MCAGPGPGVQEGGGQEGGPATWQETQQEEAEGAAAEAAGGRGCLRECGGGTHSDSGGQPAFPGTCQRASTNLCHSVSQCIRHVMSCLCIRHVMSCQCIICVMSCLFFYH